MIFHFFRIVRPNYNWFRLVHYLSIKSFLVSNPDSIARLHFDVYPNDSNWFYQLCLEFPNRIFFDKIENKDKYLEKYGDVHFAIDQIAAETLCEVGGVIADMDMICLNELEILVEDKLSIEAELDYYEHYTIGLGIGFMGAYPNNEAIKRYLKGREEFKKGEEWSKYSMDLMLNIYKEYPDLFCIIPQKVIDPFGPQYTELQDLFLHNRTLPKMTKCIHLSESQAWDQYLKHMTVEHIMTVNTTFTKCVRKFISEDYWDGHRCSLNLY